MGRAGARVESSLPAMLLPQWPGGRCGLEGRSHPSLLRGSGRGWGVSGHGGRARGRCGNGCLDDVGDVSSNIGIGCLLVALHIVKDGAGEGCRQRYRFRILGSSGGLSRWLVCWGSSTGSSGIDCLLVALHIVKDGAGEGCCQRCRFRSGDGRSRLLVCWGSGSQWCAICSVILHAVVC